MSKANELSRETILSKYFCLPSEKKSTLKEDYWFPKGSILKGKKTRLFKSIENFTSKNWKFSDKNSYVFHISAQNMDWGHWLEPPRRGGSNQYP